MPRRPILMDGMLVLLVLSYTSSNSMSSIIIFSKKDAGEAGIWYNAGVTESLPDLVTWHASDIPYRYCRSHRRTLCITVYPDLSVLVRAPMRAKPSSYAVPHRRADS